MLRNELVVIGKVFLGWLASIVAYIDHHTLKARLLTASWLKARDIFLYILLQLL